MRRKRQAIHKGVEVPRLPGTLPLIEQPAALVDGATYQQGTLHGVDFSGQQAEEVVFDQVVCKRLQLGQTQLPSGQALDVRWDGCDLAGIDWEKAYVQRNELLACRLIGAKLIEAKIEHTRFTDCVAEFALFIDSSFSSVRFEHCALREASFEGANLSGVVFRGCDLRRADLRNTTLIDTDFRGSSLEGVQIGLQELRGAIFDPMQVVHLAPLLGITIQALDDEE